MGGRGWGQATPDRLLSVKFSSQTKWVAGLHIVNFICVNTSGILVYTNRPSQEQVWKDYFNYFHLLAGISAPSS